MDKDKLAKEVARRITDKLKEQRWADPVVDEVGNMLLCELPDALSDDQKYFEFFHWTVTSGMICGLDHPIEWIINAWRTPGATLSPEYYRSCRKHTPRFLVDIFEALHMREPASAQEILDMCDQHYPEGHLCKGFFERILKELSEYVAEDRF